MKLKEFNPDNCRNNRVEKSLPSLYIHSKGDFAFNQKAILDLELKQNNQVLFFQDEKDGKNWYISKVEKGGFLLLPTKGIKSLCFNSAKLAKEIFDSVSFEGIGGACLIAGQPTIVGDLKLYGLITGRLINK